MTMWNVTSRGKYLGTVEEDSEALARCVALYKFGFVPGDLDQLLGDERMAALERLIQPDDDFDVTRA